jgi:hypothetical protein
MMVVMGWLGRGRLRPPSRTHDGFVLRYSGRYLALGLVCTFVFLGFALLSVYSGSSNAEKIKLSLGFISFSMLGWVIVAGYFIESHEISAEGIRYRTTFGRSGFIAWSQVSRVDYSYPMKWFRVSGGGKTIRFSTLLVGLPDLARAIEQYAPDSVRGAQVQELLAETAEGNPPSPWR